MFIQYWGGQCRAYHHTAPNNMIYALYAALDRVLGEGLENVHARHRAMHDQLVKGLESLGLSMYVQKESRLPMLNAVSLPQGIDDAGIRGRLLREFAIEIGGGLGPLAGKIWRIGLMGHTARQENIATLLNALKACL